MKQVRAVLIVVVCSIKRCALALCWLGLALLLCVMESQVSLAQDAMKVKKVQAEPSRFVMEEIMVTATRNEEAVKKIPKNVTVITREDIEQAPSNNIVDLLARESGVTLRSFFGHDKSAGVDIRGMGDTFASNIIVMVDGFRLNPPDLNGPDLSSIPLDQVERIEIVRGAGSVAYGDGAVGGVINIITKKGEKKPETRLYTSFGSYQTLDSRASYSGKLDKFGFNINADYYDSDGYRDNGCLRKKDTAGRFGYDIGDHVVLSLAASYHEDAYGLPGRVSKEDMDSKERRTSTDRPDDAGESIDRRYMGGITIDLEQWGQFKVQRSYRLRDNSYVMGFSSLLSREEQTDAIGEDTKDLRLDYSNHYEILGLDQQIRLGMDLYETEYVREERSKDNRENSDTKSLGVFAAFDCSLREDLYLRLGYRHHDFEGDFRTDTHQFFATTQRWVNGSPSRKQWSNHAEEIGLVYAWRPDISFFASYATSFRIPNVDELAQAQGDLKPQEGTHIDLGGRFRYKGFLEVAITLFEIKIDDEIFFDGNLELNRNYDDKTLRRGLEADVRWYITDWLYAFGNYTYTKAKFEDTDTWVPLVPEHKATLGIQWHIRDPLVLSVTGRYMGPRFDGNDQNNNRYDKLDGHAVLDAKVIYRWKDVKVFAGVNNALNKLYSTIAYSETYYPMPERNFYGGVEWSF